MLPVPRYRAYGYPPSDKFVGFGDDVLGGAVQAHELANQSLMKKRSGMMPFHMDRLQRDGLIPHDFQPFREDRATSTTTATSNTMPYGRHYGKPTQEHLVGLHSYRALTLVKILLPQRDIRHGMSTCMPRALGANRHLLQGLAALCKARRL